MQQPVLQGRGWEQLEEVCMSIQSLISGQFQIPRTYKSRQRGEKGMTCWEGGKWQKRSRLGIRERGKENEPFVLSIVFHKKRRVEDIVLKLVSFKSSFLKRSPCNNVHKAILLSSENTFTQLHFWFKVRMELFQIRNPHFLGTTNGRNVLLNLNSVIQYSRLIDCFIQSHLDNDKTRQ